MNNTIEKAMSKTAQVNKVLNEVAGEVTPETVLNQCIRMSNDKIQAVFSFNGVINAYSAWVYECDRSEPFYSETQFKSVKSKSLEEIYQDLIKIQEGEKE